MAPGRFDRARLVRYHSADFWHVWRRASPESAREKYQHPVEGYCASVRCRQMGKHLARAGCPAKTSLPGRIIQR
jgi:hypothetical protein